MKMSTWKRMAAWVAAAAVCAMPCGALAETAKQETVYVRADATGRVDDVIVETWLRNGDGLDEIADVSRLTGIENVKGDEAFARSGDDLVWQAGGGDIYYRGSTDEDPPVGVRLRYRLDGREVQPEDIVGESGHISIDVRYENDAREGDAAVPMMMLTAMLLPEGTFSNVTVENGRLVSDGSTRVAVGVGLPGLADALGLSENALTKDIHIPEGFTVEADVTDFSMRMTMTLATAFDMGDLSLDDVTGADELREALAELTDASTQLVDGSGALLEGIRSLRDASADLQDGTGTLDEKMGELADGLAELDGKKGELVKGVADLDRGAAQLNAGMSALRTGVAAYTSGAATLGEGVSAYVTGAGALAAGAEAYVAGAQQLTGSLGQYVAGADQLAAGTEAYVAGAQQLTSGIAELTEGGAAYVGGVSQLTAGVGAAGAAAANMGSAEAWQAQAAAAQQLGESGAAVGAQVSAIAADVQAAADIQSCLTQSIATDQKLLRVAQGLSGYIDQLDDAHREAIRALYGQCVSDISGSIANQQRALDAYSKYLADADAEALGRSLEALSAQVAALAGGVGQNAEAVLTVQGALTQLAGNTAALDAAGAAMTTGLNQLTTGAAALSANDEALLAGAQQLAESGAALTAGAAELTGNSAALNAGAASAAGGAAQIRGGTARLKSGSAALSEGIGQLSDGGSRLKEGTAELAQAGVDLKSGVGTLYDGATELSDGMGQFDADGVQELSRVLDEDVQAAVDDIRAAADAGRAYRSWMGLADGMSGRVQFIIQTAGVE